MTNNSTATSSVESHVGDVATFLHIAKSGHVWHYNKHAIWRFLSETCLDKRHLALCLHSERNYFFTSELQGRFEGNGSKSKPRGRVILLVKSLTQLVPCCVSSFVKQRTGGLAVRLRKMKVIHKLIKVIPLTQYYSMLQVTVLHSFRCVHSNYTFRIGSNSMMQIMS